MAAVVGQAGRLVALDFSGTLSLKVSLFGRDESLVRALKASGLWDLGVDSPAVFWEEIINPSWEVASTTRQGYVRCLAGRVKRVARAAGRAATEREIEAAARQFAEAYLAQATIDPAWGPVIREVAGRPGVWVVVATDNYAEATGHIVGELRALGVAAAPALGATQGQVAVANSADLGAHKESRGFWEALGRACDAVRVGRVAVVDDFGLNEPTLDAYGGEERARARERRTAELLAAVFGARVEVFEFLVEREGEYRAKIEEVGQFLREMVGGV